MCSVIYLIGGGLFVSFFFSFFLNFWLFVLHKKSEQKFLILEGFFSTRETALKEAYFHE